MLEAAVIYLPPANLPVRLFVNSTFYTLYLGALHLSLLRCPPLLLRPPAAATDSAPTHTYVQRTRVALPGPTSLRTATRSGCACLARPAFSRKRSGSRRSPIARRALWGFMESQPARPRRAAARSALLEHTVPSKVGGALRKIRRRGGGGGVFCIPPQGCVRCEVTV